MTFLKWIHSVKTASLKLDALFSTEYVIAVYWQKGGSGNIASPKGTRE